MRHPSSSSSSSKPQATSGGGGAKTTPCCSKVGIKRGPWTPEEDELLASCIKREGEGRWRTLPKKAGLLRCGKSCRLRWMNYLRPCVKRGHIAPDEEDLILRLHRLLGNRWSLIAGRIPGRTDNEIKNYWNTHLSKKLISQGIDPRTHKPLEQPNNPNNNSNHNKLASSSNRGNHIFASSSSHDHQSKFSTKYAPPLLVQQETDGRTNNDDSVIGHEDDQYQSQEALMSTVRNEDENADNCVITDGYYGRMDLSNHDYDCTHHDHQGLSNELDDEINVEEDINYCTDDIFSSFLNSLINEDVFNTQNLVQQQPTSAINATNNVDALISNSATGFTFGPGLDAPMVGCDASSFDQNDLSKSPDGHVEEKHI